MKLKTTWVVILLGCAAWTASAQEAPSQRAVSYAAGMNLGLQIKREGADVDIDVIAQGIKDVLDGKPSRLQPSELRPIFRQQQAADQTKKSEKNKAEGEAFLARNAKAPEVRTLPDGLQCRIIQPGSGESPKNNGTIVVKNKASFASQATAVTNTASAVPK